MADSKKIRYTTPVGEARWAHLHKPRAFQENGRDQGEPKFSIEVYFDPASPEWKEFCGKLKAATSKPLPFKWEKDGVTGEKTGLLYASYKTGEKYKPNMFDRYGQPMAEAARVGNGSKVRVAFVPNEYTSFGGGVNFYLNAVQVVDLVEYQTQDAKGYGFDAEPMPAGAAMATAGSLPPQAEDDLPF